MTPDRGRAKAIKDRLLRTTYVTAFGLTDDEMLTILDGAPRGGWRHLGGCVLDRHARQKSAIGHDRYLRCVTVDQLGRQAGRTATATCGRRSTHRCSTPHGATEGFMIAAQCFDGPYHVMSPHVVVELLDADDRPVAPGELGRVVVTRLDATAMPMIRFALGDLAVAPATARARSVLAFPQLERIVGRETDVWVSPGGRTLTVHTFTGVFEFVEEIEQFSIVPGDGTLVVEYRSPAPLGPDVIERTRRALVDAVGEDLDLAWRRVDEIPDSPSGKPQIIRPPTPPT